LATPGWRPFRNIKPTLDIPDIGPMIDKVVDELSAAEKDVQDHTDAWYRVRVSPYRSVDNRMDGVVITVVDISVVVKEAGGDIKEQRRKPASARMRSARISA
jgi:two-component system, chemotaxis family, CheB/CheR fusion protein